jgi:hypothetical protein
MKPIGTIIQTIFGTNKVPVDPTVEQATQLLAQAEDQELAAQASVESKASLLERVLSDAAMAPEDKAQTDAAGAAAVAHRKAKDLHEQAAALVRGARAKLEAAQGREASKMRSELEAEVNDKLRAIAAVGVIIERHIASLPAAVQAAADLHEHVRGLAPSAAHEMPLLLGVPYREAIARITYAAIMGLRPPGHAMTIAEDICAVVRRHLNIATPAPAVAPIVDEAA